MVEDVVPGHALGTDEMDTQRARREVEHAEPRDLLADPLPYSRMARQLRSKASMPGAR